VAIDSLRYKLFMENRNQSLAADLVDTNPWQVGGRSAVNAVCFAGDTTYGLTPDPVPASSYHALVTAGTGLAGLTIAHAGSTMSNAIAIAKTFPTVVIDPAIGSDVVLFSPYVPDAVAGTAIEGWKATVLEYLEFVYDRLFISQGTSGHFILQPPIGEGIAGTQTWLDSAWVAIQELYRNLDKSVYSLGNSSTLEMVGPTFVSASTGQLTQAGHTAASGWAIAQLRPYMTKLSVSL